MVPAPAADLSGIWVNAANFASATGMIGFIIPPGAATFEGFGACTPTPCDWEATSLTLYSTSVSSTNDVAGTAVYNFGFKQTTVTFVMFTPTVILAFDYNKFIPPDTRHNYHEMGLFVKVQ